MRLVLVLALGALSASCNAGLGPANYCFPGDGGHCAACPVEPQQPPVCRGARDCGGRPCCAYIVNTRSTVQCAQAPDDCDTEVSLDTGVVRLCYTDEDCFIGLQSTSTPVCCFTVGDDYCTGVCADTCR